MGTTSGERGAATVHAFVGTMRDNGDMPLPFDEDQEATLAAWAQHGLAAGHSDRTIQARMYTIRRLWSSVDPFSCTHEDLVNWLAGLVGRNGEPMARSSRATYRAQVRSFFVWLDDTGRRDGDPSTKLPKPKATRGIPHPVSPAEVTRILEHCQHRGSWTYAYVILGAYAGLRVHEIAKVRGEDFRGGEVRVVGKGGVSSTVPLHPKVAELAENMPRRGWWFPTDAPSGHVHRCSVSTAIRRAMDRADVAGVPHALRHHFCTQVLTSSGGDLRMTQRAARHATPATTAIYTQIADDKLARAIAGISVA